MMYLRELYCENVQVARIVNETVTSIFVDNIINNYANIERLRYAKRNKKSIFGYSSCADARHDYILL